MTTTIEIKAFAISTFEHPAGCWYGQADGYCLDVTEYSSRAEAEQSCRELLPAMGRHLALDIAYYQAHPDMPGAAERVDHLQALLDKWNHLYHLESYHTHE